LSHRQRQSLAECLDLENPEKALAEVEKWLGFYSGAVIATKTAPRASIKRGRPRGDPRMKVIDELRRIFLRFYAGGDANRYSYGSVRPLSARESDEAEFVALALDAAGIPHLRDIRRHFTAPGAATLYRGDREAQIEKLVVKVRQMRKAGRE
jgi:hypothetical protein